MEKQTLATQCFHLLREAILTGEILPSEKLLCEELKKKYGVGMSPIREALAKLAATQLVTFEEHKGYTVAVLSASKIRDEILTFAKIECLCLREAMAHGNDEWEGSIVAALHQLKKVENGRKIDYSSWAPINAAFHQALVSACPLHALLKIRQELFLLHQWMARLSYQSVDASLIKANHLGHQKIGKLAIARKMEEAAELLYKHITSGIEELISKLQSKNLVEKTF